MKVNIRIGYTINLVNNISHPTLPHLDFSGHGHIAALEVEYFIFKQYIAHHFHLKILQLSYQRHDRYISKIIHLSERNNHTATMAAQPHTIKWGIMATGGIAQSK